MGHSGLDWVERLPAELAGQRELLRSLLELCEAVGDIRWLVIGCSVARGAGDRLSDLDLGMGVTDEVFDEVIPVVRGGVDNLGNLVESYHHQLPSVTTAHERIFAQFADRCQVDLVVFPASRPIGSVRDLVVLYDPGGHVVRAGERPPEPPQQIREWAFRGWCALADAGKYLRRGSPWEALDRLAEARSQLWRLWAAAHHVPDPGYGLTSILDFAPELIPPGIELTVSDLDRGRLLAAARHLAGLLGQIGQHLPDDQRAALPAAMAGYVTSDLRQLRLAR